MLESLVKYSIEGFLPLEGREERGHEWMAAAGLCRLKLPPASRLICPGGVIMTQPASSPTSGHCIATTVTLHSAYPLIKRQPELIIQPWARLWRLSLDSSEFAVGFPHHLSSLAAPTAPGATTSYDARHRNEHGPQPRP